MGRNRGKVLLESKKGREERVWDSVCLRPASSLYCPDEKIPEGWGR